MRFELPSLLVLLLAAALGGCSSGAEAPPRDAAVEASASDAAPPSDAAAPDDADTGDAAAPTMDAATPGAAAATGLALSGAGAYGQSANYQILWTLGEGAGDNRTSSSPMYQMTLGVAGATQGK